jgi:hypothetical protein
MDSPDDQIQTVLIDVMNQTRAIQNAFFNDLSRVIGESLGYRRGRMSYPDVLLYITPRRLELARNRTKARTKWQD